MGALDQEQAKNSLFGSLGKAPSDGDQLKTPATTALKRSEPSKSRTAEVSDSGSSEDDSNAKWRNMEKVTVLLEPGQKDWLDNMAKQIMRSRNLSKDDYKERITANTVLRCLIGRMQDILQDASFQGIATEESLKEAIIYREASYWEKDTT